MRFWCLLFLAVRGSAQILVNGSFEAPGLGATVGISGAFTLPGWTGVAPGNGGNAGLVVGVDNGLGPAAGAQHFNFNGGNPSDRGWIEQGFAVTAGATYTVSFAVGRAGGGQDLSLAASVTSGGVVAAGSFLPPSGRSYADYSFTFIAGTSAAVLRFTDTSGGNSISDLYLDNVSVAFLSGPALSAVPEPHEWTLAAGLAALGSAWWRRKRPETV